MHHIASYTGIPRRSFRFGFRPLQYGECCNKGSQTNILISWHIKVMFTLYCILSNVWQHYVLKNNVHTLNALLLNNVNHHPSLIQVVAVIKSLTSHWYHRSLTNLIMEKSEIWKKIQELPQSDTERKMSKCHWKNVTHKHVHHRFARKLQFVKT